LIFFAMPLLGSAVLAVETKVRISDGKSYTVSTVDLDKESLQLFLGDGRGNYFNNFENIERWLAARRRRLVFAVNAGMFHPGFAPVGLFVDHGRTVGKLNLDRDEGNFFLKPNGVFVITHAGAKVIESSQFPALASAVGMEKVQLATQSGPLLVLDGKLHPAFREGSDSRLFRNGVGVVSPKRVVFAISNEPVNFHEFARLFRDSLGCENALFFDGSLSSIYSTEPKLHLIRFPLGPIIGITAPSE
ncbi:MAG: phosphodiester glycosidase family protein, partial [Chthoniobacteraceae bacterium]